MRMLSDDAYPTPAACRALAVALTILLAGCASKNPLLEDPAAEAGTAAQTIEPSSAQRFFWVFSPYRMNIQQGNFISREMMAQLKEGMTRDQVRFILGTPMLTDIFHADRWDYPFRLQKGSGEITTSRVAVFFKNGLVTRFDGGNLPDEKEYIARIAGPAPAAAANHPAKEESKAIININK